MKKYCLNGFRGIVVGNGITLKVSSRAESIAALVGYASEHWESCVARGRRGIRLG
jgi:hypothetical protein